MGLSTAILVFRTLPSFLDKILFSGIAPFLYFDDAEEAKTISRSENDGEGELHGPGRSQYHHVVDQGVVAGVVGWLGHGVQLVLHHYINIMSSKY